MTVGVKYEEIQAKSLMRIHDTVDDWWWHRNSMNLYRGCEHACNYCDGRSHRYHVHEDFDETIQIKVNAPELLETELKKLGFSSVKSRDSSLGDFGASGLKEGYKGPPKFVIAAGGGVSDSYQPAEKKYGLTRKVLELLRDFELPVSILTKSDLVLRDMDVLEQINERTYANVSFTLTTMDEDLREKFEPRSTSSEGRLNALSELRFKGIHGGVMLMPILPVLADSDWSVDEVVRTAKTAKAECIMYSTMSMRAEQRDRMFELLEKEFPKAVEKYTDIYRKGDWPDDNYTADTYQRVHKILRDRSMPERMARYIPEGTMANNLKVCEVLCNMAYFMQLQDIRIEKVRAYRSAGHAIDELKVDIAKMAETDKLLEVPGVGIVVAKDIKEILKTGTCALYEKLKE
jgi:DNA repair photolyase